MADLRETDNLDAVQIASNYGYAVMLNARLRNTVFTRTWLEGLLFNEEVRDMLANIHVIRPYGERRKVNSDH